MRLAQSLASSQVDATCVLCANYVTGVVAKWTLCARVEVSCQIAVHFGGFLSPDFHTSIFSALETFFFGQGAMRERVDCNQSAKQNLDMTPMVDVTFLLLIFFVVTASFQLQRAIVMPNSPNEEASRITVDQKDSPEIVELLIDEDGAFTIITAGQTAQPLGQQALIAVLKDLVLEKNDATLLVKVHQASRLQSLVNGMDAGTTAGFSRLRVVQLPEII